MKTYKSIFISDTHLGTREAQADLLNDFLKHNHADNLFLVGNSLLEGKVK
jgi:UDP-2,3-diacylglucosamine pyrophosphatase LpxH